MIEPDRTAGKSELCPAYHGSAALHRQRHSNYECVLRSPQPHAHFRSMLQQVPRSLSGRRLIHGVLFASLSAATAFGGRTATVTTPAPLTFETRRTPVARPPKRTFLPVEWTKTVLVEGSLDSDLLKPGLLDSRGTMLYLFDYGDLSVRAYDAKGQALWRVGRQGQGPGEFDNPTDLKVDARGRVWLTDPANARITVIDARGHLVRTIPTTARVERILPLSTGGFVGFGPSGNATGFARYDSLAQTPDAVIHPAWMDTASPVVSGLRVAQSPDGRSAAIGQVHSGRILLMQSTAGGAREIPVVESQTLPRPIMSSPRARVTVTRRPKDARPLIQAITADTAFVYVLFSGATEERGRIVDRYQLRDGTYGGSYRLPESVDDITAIDGGFAVLMNEPTPALYLFRRRDSK